jgi:hypothetical protein
MPLIDTNDHVVAGLIHYPGPRQVVSLLKVTADVIPKGALLFNDTGDTKKWKVCGTAGAEKGPFAVATQAAANGDTRVAAVVSGAIVTVTADGAIPQGGFVKPSTSTAGQVIAWSAPAGAVVTNAITSFADLFLKVGVYLKQANSVPMGDGVTAVTDAADGDIIEMLIL